MPAFEGLDKALRWLRLERHLKQCTVARAAGVTQAMLCSYEQGKRRPSLKTLEKILDTLEVGLPDLAEVLAMVNAGLPLPAAAGERASQGGSRQPRPGRQPDEIAEPRVDIYGVLQIDGPLPEQKELAFNEMLSGFCHWLRFMHEATSAMPGVIANRASGEEGY
jgi:transcriptional regulator with XRE-family HTH domain